MIKPKEYEKVLMAGLRDNGLADYVTQVTIFADYNSWGSYLVATLQMSDPVRGFKYDRKFQDVRLLGKHEVISAFAKEAEAFFIKRIFREAGRALSGWVVGGDIEAVKSTAVSKPKSGKGMSY